MRILVDIDPGVDHDGQEFFFRALCYQFHKVGTFNRYSLEHFIQVRQGKSAHIGPTVCSRQYFQHPGQQAVSGKVLKFQLNMLCIGNFAAAFVNKGRCYQQGRSAFINGRTQESVGQTYQQADQND